MVRVMEIIRDEYSGIRSCRRPHHCGFDSKLKKDQWRILKKGGAFSFCISKLV